MTQIIIVTLLKSENPLNSLHRQNWSFELSKRTYSMLRYAEDCLRGSLMHKAKRLDNFLLDCEILQ